MPDRAPRIVRDDRDLPRGAVHPLLVGNLVGFRKSEPDPIEKLRKLIKKTGRRRRRKK